MRNILFLCLFFIISNICLSQSLIAVQNSDEPEFYSDLSEAIENAVAGDTLYLPARNFVIEDTIRKKLHLVGVGYHPDFSQGSGVTILSKPNALRTQLRFENGSDGSSITGIRFETTTTSQGQANPNIVSDNTTSNLSITRNYFRASLSLASSSSFIVENFFGGRFILNSENGGSSIVSNNVFFDSQNNFVNCNVENSIFTRRPNFNSAFTCRDSVLKNNIFPNNPFYNGFAAFNSTFYNNVNLQNGSLQQGSFAVNNLDPNIEIEDIFEEPNWSTFLTEGATFEFALPSGSPYLSSGTNGGQTGIYGGRFPWKQNAVPFNPHIVSKSISGTTDENGNLQVEIEVQAQGN